jgi:tripartite-type tricarboxylate transporter receptor subunit TctC
MAPRRFAHSWLALASVTAMLGLGGAAHAADDYPTRPIDVIVPLPAGSAADGVARIVLPKVEEILGQPLVIENIGGAAHLPGMARASEQEPDGYYLLWATIADFSSNPNLYAELPYSPSDFAPIGRVSAQSLIMAVPTSSGIDSVEEFVEKARGQSLAYASTGIGNSNHLLGEMLMQDAGIEMRHIPYEGGSPAVLDLMRGEIDVMFYSLSQFQPGIQSGELKLLGITAGQRSKFLPDLPTMQEMGYGDVLVTSWYALFAPAGTPQEYIDTVFNALDEALQDPEIVAALEATGTEVWASESPAEFAEFLAAEQDRYARLVDAIGLEKR